MCLHHSGISVPLQWVTTFFLCPLGAVNSGEWNAPYLVIANNIFKCVLSQSVTSSSIVQYYTWTEYFSTAHYTHLITLTCSPSLYINPSSTLSQFPECSLVSFLISLVSCLVALCVYFVLYLVICTLFLYTWVHLIDNVSDHRVWNVTVFPHGHIWNVKPQSDLHLHHRMFCLDDKSRVSLHK